MVTKQARKRAEMNGKARSERETKIPYQETIGSFLYLANVSRPDILYTVNYSARK